MDENTYLRLAEQAFRAIGDAFENVDSDLADCEVAGDVVTLTLRGSSGSRKCIVNTQRPTRQIWFAANSRAWHFSWDPAAGLWIDDRGRGDELFTTIARTVKEGAGIEVVFP